MNQLVFLITCGVLTHRNYCFADSHEKLIGSVYILACNVLVEASVAGPGLNVLMSADVPYRYVTGGAGVLRQSQSQ